MPKFNVQVNSVTISVEGTAPVVIEDVQECVKLLTKLELLTSLTPDQKELLDTLQFKPAKSGGVSSGCNLGCDACSAAEIFSEDVLKNYQNMMLSKDGEEIPYLDGLLKEVDKDLSMTSVQSKKPIRSVQIKMRDRPS